MNEPFRTNSLYGSLRELVEAACAEDVIAARDRVTDDSKHAVTRLVENALSPHLKPDAADNAEFFRSWANSLRGNNQGCRTLQSEIERADAAASTLAAWIASLPEAGPEAYLFPRHAVGFGPDGQKSAIYNIDFGRPTKGWKSA